METLEGAMERSMEKKKRTDDLATNGANLYTNTAILSSSGDSIGGCIFRSGSVRRSTTRKLYSSLHILHCSDFHSLIYLSSDALLVFYTYS